MTCCRSARRTAPGGPRSSSPCGWARSTTSSPTSPSSASSRWGLSAWQVVAAIMISAVIVSIGYILNGQAAAKYGVPFAMQLREAFGHKGALLPTWIRGIIAGGGVLRAHHGVVGQGLRRRVRHDLPGLHGHRRRRDDPGPRDPDRDLLPGHVGDHGRALPRRPEVPRPVQHLGQPGRVRARRDRRRARRGQRGRLRPGVRLPGRAQRRDPR